MKKVLFIPVIGETPQAFPDRLAYDLKRRDIDLIVMSSDHKDLATELASEKYQHLVISNDQLVHMMDSITSPERFVPPFKGMVHNAMRDTLKGNAFELSETRHHKAYSGYRINTERLDECLDYSRLLREISEDYARRETQISQRIGESSS